MTITTTCRDTYHSLLEFLWLHYFFVLQKSGTDRASSQKIGRSDKQCELSLNINIYTTVW